MKEQWKKVVGFERFYEVSNLGNVRRLKGYSRTKTRNLKPQKHNYGYNLVRLQCDGTTAQRLVHRIVAEAFLTDWNPNLQCNHINGDKRDNRVSNIEMVTAKQNMQHAVDNKLLDLKKKVTQYTMDGEYVNTYESISECAKVIGVTFSAISSVLRGRNRKCRGFVFKYTNPENNK